MVQKRQFTMIMNNVQANHCSTVHNKFERIDCFETRWSKEGTCVNQTFMLNLSICMKICKFVMGTGLCSV